MTMTKPTPVKTPKPSGHRSVKEMARDLLADDPEFVNDLENRLRDREFVKSLTVIRSRSGLSQQELAAKIGCTQSKISKLESGNDVDLKFGDIVSYLQAANYEAKIFFVPKGGNLKG